MVYSYLLTLFSWYVNQISATSVADLSWTSSFLIMSSKVLGPTKLKLNSRSVPATMGRWSCRLHARLTNRLASIVVGSRYVYVVWMLVGCGSRCDHGKYCGW